MTLETCQILCLIGIALSTSVLKGCGGHLCHGRICCVCLRSDTEEWCRQKHAHAGCCFSGWWWDAVEPSVTQLGREGCNFCCCQTCTFHQCREKLRDSFHCSYSWCSGSLFAWELRVSCHDWREPFLSKRKSCLCKCQIMSFHSWHQTSFWVAIEAFYILRSVNILATQLGIPSSCLGLEKPLGLLWPCHLWQPGVIIIVRWWSLQKLLLLLGDQTERANRGCHVRLYPGSWILMKAGQVITGNEENQEGGKMKQYTNKWKKLRVRHPNYHRKLRQFWRTSLCLGKD